MAQAAKIKLIFGPEEKDSILISAQDLAELSTKCEYFEVLLHFNGDEGSNRDSIDISHNEVDPASLGQVIKTLLNIESSERIQNAVSFLEATIYLQCQTEIQAEMLINNISWSNCFQIFHIGSEHGLHRLTEAAGMRCLDVVNSHSYVGHKWEDIMELPMEHIRQFVRDNVPSSSLSLLVIFAWVTNDPESRLRQAEFLVREAVVPELLSLDKPPLSCHFWEKRFPTIIAGLREQLRLKCFHMVHNLVQFL